MTPSVLLSCLWHIGYRVLALHLPARCAADPHAHTGSSVYLDHYCLVIALSPASVFGSDVMSLGALFYCLVKMATRMFPGFPRTTLPLVFSSISVTPPPACLGVCFLIASPLLSLLRGIPPHSSQQGGILVVLSAD